MTVVGEADVLIGAALWLWNRGVPPLRVSIAVGSVNGKFADRARVNAAFKAAGVPEGWSSRSDGADLVAANSSELWEVECKGAGAGVSATQRNNFDRALASVVSHYGSNSPEASAMPAAARYLGLALPSTPNYMRELTRRVRVPLRSRLNLWILLFDLESQTVTAVGPDQEYPQ